MLLSIKRLYKPDDISYSNSKKIREIRSLRSNPVTVTTPARKISAMFRAYQEELGSLLNIIEKNNADELDQPHPPPPPHASILKSCKSCDAEASRLAYVKSAQRPHDTSSGSHNSPSNSRPRTRTSTSRSKINSSGWIKHSNDFSTIAERFRCDDRIGGSGN